MKKSVLAITMGDPGGVGPEVIVKSLSRRKLSPKIVYLLIGAKSVFEYLKDKKKLKLQLNSLSSFNPAKLKKGRINFLDISDNASKHLKKSSKRGGVGFDIGKVSARNAALTFESLEKASELARKGFVQGLVTAPVNKTAIRLIHSKFDGHTDYLAWKAHRKSYAMMFVGNKLNVTLATIHIPLHKVPKNITKRNILEKIDLTNQFLKKKLKIKNPKLAVCALNPHGEETGKEELKVIVPAIKAANKKRIKAFGPFSADSLFFTAAKGYYDAVISMYHDQGLAPFKMISFEEGVNTTLGLPYVRTSPDHGTAFEIAYKNKANATSMKSSIKLAEKLIS